MTKTLRITLLITLCILYSALAFSEERKDSAAEAAEKWSKIMNLINREIQTIKSNNSDREKERELIRLFSTETNYFWKHHYHFDEAAPKNVTALGTIRIREIIINAVLPVTLLYARIFKDKTIRECALQLYSFLPASENNAITRLMEKQLLKGQHCQERASHQQAVIQLYTYYCLEGRCTECDLGQKLFM